MKRLQKKTLALALAAAMLFAVPVNAASGSIADLVTRASNVTAAMQLSSAEPAEEAPAQEEVAQVAPVQEAPVQAAAAQETTKQGIITGGTINVRKGPGTEYDRITQVATGKVVTILGTESGWYHIQFGNTTGYVLGDYLREYVPGAASAVGEQIIQMAMQYMGVRYRSGGSSPNGFDCSGFTLYLFGQLGYSLPHSATSQYKNCGTYVAKADLQPGDLVFFSDSSHAIGHVGIYIGNGEIIHARYSVGCVTTNSLSMSYYVNRYVGAKRIA